MVHGQSLGGLHVQAQIRKSFNATKLQLENGLAGEKADRENAAYNAL